MSSKTTIIIPPNPNLVPVRELKKDDWFEHNGDLYLCIINRLIDKTWQQYFIRFGAGANTATIRPHIMVKKMDVTIEATEVKSC